MKKQIPLLCQTLMVQAIIAGRKTMTRRTRGLEFINDSLENERSWEYLGVNELGHLMKNNFGAINAIKCPYGKPGDILWVRESFARVNGEIAFKANEAQYKFAPGETKGLWKPSIHMPKTVARIWLEVTHIRIERLHDITPGDACDEGVEYWNIDHVAFEGGELQADFKNYDWKDDPSYEDYGFPHYANPVSSFFSLWRSINGKESLLLNPWVWVVSFKVLSPKGKPDFDKHKKYDFNCRTNLETSYY